MYDTNNEILLVFVNIIYCKDLVLILYANSEIGAHIRVNLYWLICLTLNWKQLQIVCFSPERPIFLHACAICSELPSNFSAMLRETGKKVPPLVVWQLRGWGGGLKAEPLRKITFLEALKKFWKKRITTELEGGGVGGP